jgi:hypothetical protein
LKRLILMLALLCAMPVAAEVVATTPRGVAIAHDGVIELRANGRLVWSAPGVDQATAIIVGDARIAVLDAWANRVRIVSLSDGNGTTFTTGETPTGGVFVGNELFIIARDANRLERIGPEGSRASLDLADPAFIGATAERLFIYSRIKGSLAEVATGDRDLLILRELALPPHASDMEVESRTAYLIYPREAKLITVNLDNLEIAGSVSAGGAPTDIAIAGHATALSAPVIAIADPGAKRVWMTEGVQSVGAAFGRGFLRGFLGLGLFRPRSVDFPRGIDRVTAADGVILAFDSSSGTLYRVERTKVVRIAEGIDPKGFAVSGGKAVFWSAGALQQAQ